MHVNRERLWNHLKVLCQDIGPRLSGTPADERAVEYIAGHFRRCGAQVEVQDYPCPSWECQGTELTLLGPGGPEPLTALAQTFAEACDLEAALASVGTRHELDLAPDLEGKVLLLHGEAATGLAFNRNPTLLTAEERRARALIVVSPEEAVSTKLIRDPFLRVPAAAVPQSVGLRLRRNEGRRVRLRIDARRYDSTGHNVIGRLDPTEGSADRPERSAIVVAAHYDTAAASPGATDNASGTAVVLELCELFAEQAQARPGARRLGIDFIAYGAEEYGRHGRHYGHGDNLGSAEYVRHHPDSVREARAVVEADCVGTAIVSPRLWHVTGWTSRQKEDILSVMRRFPRLIIEDSPARAPGPFHLPGVPALTFVNEFERLYIHTAQDTIDLMSPDELAFIAEVIAAAVDHLSS
jgi:aminopeptidase YwaD